MASIMTKRHFEVIATALAKARPPDDSGVSGICQGERDILKAKDEQWIHDVSVLCDALQTTNPNFNRDMFTDWIQSKGRTRYTKK